MPDSKRALRISLLSDYEGVLLYDSPGFCIVLESVCAAKGVVGVFHFGDAVEVAHEVDGTCPLSGSGGASADLGDHADVVALMAPGLIDCGGIEGHSREPDAVLELHGTNEAVGQSVIVAPVEVAGIRREVLVEDAFWDKGVIVCASIGICARICGSARLSRVTQIDLAEDISSVVANVAGHIEAHHDGGNVLGAGEPIPGEEPASVVGEEQMLLPL